MEEHRFIDRSIYQLFSWFFKVTVLYTSWAWALGTNRPVKGSQKDQLQRGHFEEAGADLFGLFRGVLHGDPKKGKGVAW